MENPYIIRRYEVLLKLANSIKEGSHQKWLWDMTIKDAEDKIAELKGQ